MSRGSLAAAAGPLVVKVGGGLLEGDGPEAIAGLAPPLRRGGGVVLVHGGGTAVDRQLAALGFDTVRREGIRITPPEQMDAIAGVLAGSVNKRLVAALLAAGVPAAGVCLGDGGLAACRRRRGGFDAGCVGEVAGGEGGLLRVLLAAGYLPVVSSIGIGEDGELLNLNADDAAAGLARILDARELLLLTDTAGVRGRDGGTLRQLDREAIDRGIAEGWIEGGMVAKVRSALHAAETAGIPVRIASWRDPQSLCGEAAGGTRILPHAPIFEALSPR
jgi:acetylglutamate kinase